MLSENTKIIFIILYLSIWRNYESASKIFWLIYILDIVNFFMSVSKIISMSYKF